MFSRSKIAVALLVGLGAHGMGLALGQSTGVARRTTPGAPSLPAARLPPAADLIYKYVTKHPGQLAWQRIPWLVDLPEAIRQSKAENRPVLLFVSADDPLERC